MRILFMIEDLAGGGAERVVSLLANSLCVDNAVGVLAIRGDKVEYELNKQVSYMYIEASAGSKISRMTGRFSAIRRELRRFHPDIILAFDTFTNIYAIACAKLTGYRVIVSERNDPNRFPAQKRARALRDAVYRFADGFVFQTEDAKNYFSEKIRRRSTVIPNPINEAFAMPRFEGERRKEIVTVCRLNKQKNLHLFVDIISEVTKTHPEFCGLIYGEGPEEKELSDYAQSVGAGENVKLMGRTNDVRGAIYESFAYLCTSDFEGISNSILEAMALGLPVIATDCPIGGTRMAIQDGENGLLFPVGDKANGVSSVVKLIESAGLREKLSLNATEISQRWSAKAIANAWVDYIEHFSKHNGGVMR